ncbi:MAG: 5,5'-dehydrodivanillate O-demethylase [Alphaproteobacteria bacterium]|jgi:5,5'-dehydrodivanillate O-demethylase
MLSGQENELLTRVGASTPCGDLMRRYWWPVQFSENIKDRPVKVRLLGQDFVVFRDGNGTLGMLDLQCCHRLTSLEFGRVEQNGIRCCYHGWLFDAQGKCLEQPAERPDSNYKDKVRQGAYEVQDLGGFVWAYIGPQPAPLIPHYDLLHRTDGRRVLTCSEDYCNWLQKAENGLDLSHLPFLHASSYPHMAFKTPVDYDFIERSYGYKCVMHIENIAPRIIHFIFPAHTRVSTTPRANEAISHDIRFRVPVDDTLTHSYVIRFYPNRDGKFEQDTRGYVGKQPGVYMREENGYWNLPSREQDRVAQETQGLITNRSLEHLAASDRGIIMFRNKLNEAIEAVAQGKDPDGLIRDPAQNMPIKFETTLDEEQYVGRP